MVVLRLGGLWVCGPRSPPEGPKQRRRERERERQRGHQEPKSERAREAQSATDGLFLYVGASFPARGGPRREAEIGSRTLGCL